MSRRLPQGLRQLAREAGRDGWQWERLGSGHVRFWHPATSQTVTAASTSRDTNQHRILRRQMVRALDVTR